MQIAEKKLWFNRVALTILTISIISLMAACSDGDKDKDGPPDDQPDTLSVILSGQISIANGSSVDSDVNDLNAPYKSNNSLDTAQSIPNPTTLGGYVNVAGAGVEGRSTEEGDEVDYFSVQLLAGQRINLTVDDLGTDDKPNKVMLHLLDDQGTPLQHTLGESKIESITINQDGLYYLRVLANEGASNYLLTIGLSVVQQDTSSVIDLDINRDFMPGEVIVEFKPNTFFTASKAPIGNIATTLGMRAKAGSVGRSILMEIDPQGTGSTARFLGLQSQQSVNTSNTAQSAQSLIEKKLETIEVVKKLRQRSDIKTARLNYLYKASQVPNDEFYELQWHYPQINLPQAWDITTGSEPVIVAVIDTGILSNHPDLQGQLVPGYDFISDPANAADGDGIDDDPYDVGDDPNGFSSFHGTHVSGTIAASSNNTNGVAGVAWNVKIMPLRVLGRFGGSQFDIEEAVRFAAGLENASGTLPQQKADVINLSLGGPTNDTNPGPNFSAARDAGVIVIAAAGNESSNALNYPSSLDGVVSVSAVGLNSKLASYSNFGTTVDVSAPGGDFTDINGDGFQDGVLSTVGSDANGPIELGYAFYQGTSMAAPHVAGVAALMKSVKPDLTPDEFDTFLSSGVITNDLGAQGRDNQFGYGLIDAHKAVLAASDDPNNEPPPDPEPIDPIISVNPKALNFSYNIDEIEFSVVNSGGGVLIISKVENNSGGWLQTKTVNVDGNGLGSYRASVDRSLLPDGNRTYSAIISVSSETDSYDISVIMQKLKNDYTDSSGQHYVMLVNKTDPDQVKLVAAKKVGAVYQFVIEGVGVGTYTVKGGTDLNGNGVICEIGEACGDYYIPTHVVEIEISEDSGSRAGLNFQTQFETILNGANNSRFGQNFIPLKELSQ